ncbi:MAG: aromatic amino acid ammonia-lyase [Pseudomonadota bacterium]
MHRRQYEPRAHVLPAAPLAREAALSTGASDDVGGAAQPSARPVLAEPITITLSASCSLSARNADLIAAGGARLTLGEERWASIEAAHRRLGRVIDEARTVYGITTGFGPLANRALAPGQAVGLQHGLVAHLATGIGPAFGWREARLILLARLLSIAAGYSGASPVLVRLLLTVLDSDLAPSIPTRGTVGASGDLTPLAHMALCLMGRASFIDADGEAVAPAEAFARLRLSPLTLEARDGLALVNGTSAMTGLSVRNGLRAARLLAWSEALSHGMAELQRARAEHWDQVFAVVRPHPGQQGVTRRLAALRADGARLALDPAAAIPGGAHRAVAAETEGPDDEAMQDAYSLRCVPQILGAAADAFAFHDCVVERELNAVTDNPIFPEGPTPALHGGNFMGSHVAIAADLLANATLTVAQLVERQTARLTDERLNRGLPPFLQRGTPGLNSGLMGAQVTATALLAEMRTRAVPAAAQSISTNAANQDVVSMGTIAARNAALQLDDTARILAILALSVAQGIDVIDARGDAHGLSAASRAIHGLIRTESAPLLEDRPLAGDIVRIASLIEGAPPPAEPYRDC